MSLPKLDYPSEYKKTGRGFQVPELLLLGAGPTNISHRVRRILSSQCLIPMTEEMFTIMDEVKMMAKYVFQTKNRLTLASQTSGNGGNEMIVRNLLDPGQRIIVAIGGAWGEKVFDMAQRYHLDAVALRKPPGLTYSLEELEAAIVKHKPQLLFVTHGESTGGTIQRLEGLAPMCHRHGCLLAVDVVVSIAVEPLFVDRWEIDAVCAGSQKALGAPPGLCLLSFSPRAEKAIFERKEPTPYYYDLKMLGDFWKCFDNPRIYVYTLSSTLVAGMREALAEICEEGLENMWARHRASAELFCKGLEKLQLTPFVENAENRFVGVTCVNIPPDIHWPVWLKYLKEKYAIDVSPGYGPTLNKALRIGFLGVNSCPEIVQYMLDALKDSLAYCRNQEPNGV